MVRGIIASQFVFAGTEDAVSIQGTISTDELRYYVLYWDKVVIPNSPFISVKLPEEDTLVQTGVISRPSAAVNRGASGKLAQLVRLTQATLAKDLLLGDKETDWTLHQSGPLLTLPAEFEINTRTVRVDLQNALPIPLENVPMADILEFKDRRRDELEVLHQHLDEAYLEILRSPDPALERHIVIERLRKSIADLDAVTKERWKSTKKLDLSAELNLDGAKLLAGIAATAAFDFYKQTGLGIPLSIAAGGLISMFKVSAKATMSFEPAKHNLKLSYLSHAQGGAILPRGQSSRARFWEIWK